jgi:hypothetical protein
MRMKKLLPFLSLFFILAPMVVANAASINGEATSEYRAYFQPGQDNPSREVEMYPNPVTEGRLTISSTDNILSIQILNITGKIVFSQEYQPDTNTVDLELDKLEKGIYLVRVSFAGKETHTEKVMIK